MQEVCCISIPYSLLIVALTGKMTVFFKNIAHLRGKSRVCKTGEQHLCALETGRRKFGVVDVLQTRRAPFGEIADDEIRDAGFESRDHFIHWWIEENGQRLTDDDVIGVVNFDLLLIHNNGKDLLRGHGLQVPRVRR
jgi:hypothetical protein